MQPNLWLSICGIILLSIATVVCLLLKIYMGALFVFVVTLILAVWITYVRRGSPVQPETTFVSAVEITIVSVPVETKVVETSQVKLFLGETKY